MRRKLIYSLIGLVGCTWLAGCQEKPEGAQTIIIELADPTDMQENVTLYRLNEDGELVSETLEVTDGTVSYQSTGCGRWLILDTLLEQETEAMSESETEVN